MNMTMGKTAGDGEGKLTPEGTHNRLRQCELERELHHCSQEVKRLQAQLAMGVQAHVARSRQIHQISKRAQQADLCFLVDCTGSMEGYIVEVKDKICAIVDGVSRTSKNLDLRLAFVGYRDFCDETDRLSTLPFGKDVEGLARFISGEIANGGGDAPEDVFGGLDAVLGLNWEADTRVLIHIGDAPCHGSRFHPAHISDHGGHALDINGKDRNGLSAEGLIFRLKSNAIAYHFYHVCRRDTKRMIEEFNKIASKLSYVIFEADLKETATLLEKFAVQSVTRSIADSARALSKQVGFEKRCEVVLGEGCQFDPRPPNWRKIPQELACATWYELPSSIDALQAGMELQKMNGVIMVKVAPKPFSEGHLRWAFQARCLKGKCGMPRNVVIKKLKCDRDSSIIACEDHMEIQCIAKYLAHEFNVRLQSKDGKLPKLEFLMVWSIQMVERQIPFYANMEPFLAGDFEKFNSNLGYVSECHDVLQAFSHWTHHVTKGYLMVVDLQGVKVGSKYILTDPAIHCTELVRNSPYLKNQFGNTNLGEEGMRQFFATHECNSVCRALNL